MFHKRLFLRTVTLDSLTYYQKTNFRLFQTDDNFKFDENGRRLSEQVENTVGKGEIARYEQFLLFPQCFQKACFPEASKGVIVWEWVNGALSNIINSSCQKNNNGSDCTSKTICLSFPKMTNF